MRPMIPASTDTRSHPAEPAVTTALPHLEDVVPLTTATIVVLGYD